MRVYKSSALLNHSAVKGFMTHRTVAILGSLAMLAALTAAAFAHTAASGGWAYPFECCSDRDCEPMADSDVMEMPDHFALLATGEQVERSRARRSGDGGYHICRAPDNSIRCFFYPPKSM